MNKISRIFVTLLMSVITLFGMKNYFSLNGFVKPVAWQMLLGYTQNEFVEGATPVQKINTIKSTIEQMFNEVGYKEFIINFNGLFQKVADKKVVDDVEKENTVVRLNNDYLTFLSGARDYETAAQNTDRLNSYLKGRKTDFLFVMAPGKISKFDPQLPVGVEDYSNSDMDNYLKIIASKDIDYIDIRSEMYDSGLNQYDYFFKTDHHWTPEAAFFAYQKVSERLKEYGLTVDEMHLNPENYNKKVYEDWFLGSQGKRTGIYYGGVDDISLITPKFETSFTVITGEKEKSGDFENTMFQNNHIEVKDYFGRNPYAVYTGGDFPLQIMKNHKCDNDKKILLIRNSFACTFAPFMALDCEELHILDLRHYEDGTVKEYIEQINPDIVMILYNNAFNEIMFNFGL